jgi:hypothetical protein
MENKITIFNTEYIMSMISFIAISYSGFHFED